MCVLIKEEKKNRNSSVWNAFDFKAARIEVWPGAKLNENKNRDDYKFVETHANITFEG